MEFGEAARIVEGLPGPHIPMHRAQVLYRHIRQARPTDVLELGTARGGSAVFIAAALQANRHGHLTSVDSTRWQWRDPTPRQVLDGTGLSHRVTLDQSCSTYTWFLKRQPEASRDAAGSIHPVYDLIFLDGAKNWTTDGLAVLLAERLLRPGGWLLLDDLGWSYAEHADNPWHYGIEIATLADDERAQPHLRAAFDLLIRANPAFDRAWVQDGWWGWARKSPHGLARWAARAASGIWLSPVRRLRRAVRRARATARAHPPAGIT